MHLIEKMLMLWKEVFNSIDINLCTKIVKGCFMKASMTPIKSENIQPLQNLPLSLFKLLIILRYQYTGKPVRDNVK